jgi:hypothetical protein
MDEFADGNWQGSGQFEGQPLLKQCHRTDMRLRWRIFVLGVAAIIRGVRVSRTVAMQTGMDVRTDGCELEQAQLRTQRQGDERAEKVPASL